MLRRTFLVCGALSSLLYVVGDVLAGVFYPQYHSYRSQMVSELMATGAPTRSLMVWLFIPYNLLVFAFAGGVWRSAEERRATRLTAMVLVGYGVLSSAGLMLTPMDMRGTGPLPAPTILHIWDTVVQGIFIMLALVFGAFVHGSRFRLYSFATLFLCLAFGAWAGAQATQQSTPWLGLTERVNIYAWMLWIAVLAVSLLHARHSSATPVVGQQRRGPQPAL